MAVSDDRGAGGDGGIRGLDDRPSEVDAADQRRDPSDPIAGLECHGVLEVDARHGDLDEDVALELIWVHVADLDRGMVGGLGHDDGAHVTEVYGA